MEVSVRILQCAFFDGPIRRPYFELAGGRAEGDFAQNDLDSVYLVGLRDGICWPIEGKPMQRIFGAKFNPLAIGANCRWRAEAKEEVGFVAGEGVERKREEHFIIVRAA